MARIFLCYAREDAARVRDVYRRLRALGFELWMDKVNLLPGQRWQLEIPRALRASDFVLIFLSRNSVNKRGYVQREFKLALDTLQEVPEDVIRTIPVRLDNCDIPEQFGFLQWCDLFARGGFQRLVQAIRAGASQRPEPAVRLEESTSPAAGQSPVLTLSPPLTNSIGMEFVLMPAGTFMMGSPDSDAEAHGDEKPAHRVTISQPFYLGKYPVTQAQWEAVMGNNPSSFKGNPNHPVENVSWNDVQAFLRKLNEQEGGGDYRLPTEAQWEYACRAGTEPPRYHPDVNAIAWYKENSNDHPQPVGQKLPNAWGLYDMLGNIWEWCLDGLREYTADAAVNPMGPRGAGADRVIRGGSWYDPAQGVRAAYRVWYHPGDRNGSLGFRCASSSPST